jgi:hypothetical protein
MDHAPGMRPAAGSGTGPQGRPRRERMTARARRPAETPGIPAETPRHARETRVTCRMETPGLPGAETRGIPAANARHPGGKRVAWRGVNAQIIVRQTITRQVSAPLGGKRRRLAKPAAERTPGGGPGERVWIARSFRVDETVRGAGGRAAPRPRWRAGRAGHFQITNSEIANTWSQHRKRQLSIHLRASYPNEISCCR